MKPEKQQIGQSRREPAPAKQGSLTKVTAPPRYRTRPLASEDLSERNKSRNPLAVIVNLKPGQIPNVEKLVSAGRELRLVINYAAGMSKFRIIELHKSGWGNYPFRAEEKKACRQLPFTVAIGLPVGEQGPRDDKGNILMGNYGTLELYSSRCPNDGLSHVFGQFEVAREFRDVLSEAYKIGRDEEYRAAGLTSFRSPSEHVPNFKVNGVPSFHNLDFYQNGIVLHTGEIRHQTMVNRAGIFQAALTAYFTAKGYRTELVDLINKGKLVTGAARSK